MDGNDRNIPRSQVDESIDRYIETLRKAEGYVSSQNAIFFHFLQPTLFTKQQHNRYDKSLIDMGPPFVSKQSKRKFEVAYPIMIDRLSSEEYSESLIDAFDQLETSPYLDFCHVNHIGNQIIADRIWSSVKRKLELNG